jgi:integrase
MATKIKTRLSSRAARTALKARRKPHDFTTIAPGVAIGYRRNKGGPGTWVLRTADGRGGAATARIAAADDISESDGGKVLTFWEACERGRSMARGGPSDTTPATLAKAVDDYEASLKARGGDTANASRVRGHLDAALARKPVAALTAVELRRWRDGLIESGMARGTVLRTTKALAAALNHAESLDPRIANRAAWRSAFAGLGDTYTPVNKVIGDDEVRALVKACRARDAALGLFADVLAATGTRTSQACALTVADLVDGVAPRLMMPSSRKGRGRKPDRKPVPVTPGLAARLKAAAAGRDGSEPLLVQADGRSWSAARNPKPGNLIREAAAGIGSAATAYSFRHSSIVRALVAGVPVRVVAASHDTSVAMIEKTYSHFVMDHADAVARRGLIDLDTGAGGPGGNVVSLPVKGQAG